MNIINDQFKIQYNFKKSFDPRPWLVSFQGFAQKSVKIRKWFWESLRVGPDLEHGQIDNWNFDAKQLLIRAKIKLRLRISKFSSSIHYTTISTHSDHNFKIFLPKTKNLLVTWSKSLINEIFVIPSIFVFNANNPRT